MSVPFTLDTSMLHLLHRASQVADEHFAEAQEPGRLTSRQFVVLAAVSNREGASQTDISEMTGIDRSTLTDLVGRLQAKGFVSRARSRHDARTYEVRLTPVGNKALSVAVPIARKVDRKLLSLLPEVRRKELARMLEKIGAIGSDAAAREPGMAG